MNEKLNTIITLLPLYHRGTEQIGLQFKKDSELNNLIKKIKGIKWSNSKNAGTCSSPKKIINLF